MMYLHPVASSSFALLFLIPVVTSLPHAQISHRGTDLTGPPIVNARDVEISHRGTDLTEPPIVNARDVEISDRGADLAIPPPIVNARDVETSSRSNEPPIVNARDVNARDLLPALTSRQDEGEPDPDCPHCPYVNARSEDLDAREFDETSQNLIDVRDEPPPKPVNARELPTIEARQDETNPEADAPHCHGCPYVNARRDVESDGSIGVWLWARKNEDLDNDGGGVFLNARDEPSS